MGVLLTPIITKETIGLADLRGRTLAVDGNAELYQFLALYGRIEQMPDEVRSAVGPPDLIAEIRRIYLCPDVTDAFQVTPSEPDLDGVLRFLCKEREFGRDRVEAALSRAFGQRLLP